MLMLVGDMHSYKRLLVIFFAFFAQRPRRTARRTATVEGTNGVFLAKEVPFGGLNNEK